MKELQSMQSAF